jgi:hypothetical protein
LGIGPKYLRRRGAQIIRKNEPSLPWTGFFHVTGQQCTIQATVLVAMCCLFGMEENAWRRKKNLKKPLSDVVQNQDKEPLECVAKIFQSQSSPGVVPYGCGHRQPKGIWCTSTHCTMWWWQMFDFVMPILKWGGWQHKIL